MPLTRGNYSNKIVQLPVRVQLGRNRRGYASRVAELARLISEYARINSGKSCCALIKLPDSRAIVCRVQEKGIPRREREEILGRGWMKMRLEGLFLERVFFFFTLERFVLNLFLVFGTLDA